MNSATVTPSRKKLRNYASPVNLLKSLIPRKILQKQPNSFASALAHEVRNPLSNINLAVEMLRLLSRDDDPKVYLDIIIRSSIRINDLVTAFLVSNKADGMQTEKHSIHQLLDEVLAMNEDRIMLKNIIVRKDYTTLDCKIIVDKPKVKIALTNIIINAIEAMPSKMGRLKLVTRSINGNCVIEIEDNGIGISEENLKNIFKPYFTNKTGGMGLGLSTTLDILLSNHARVDVKSEEGRGTRFILSFEGIQQLEELF